MGTLVTLESFQRGTAENKNKRSVYEIAGARKKNNGFVKKNP